VPSASSGGKKNPLFSPRLFLPESSEKLPLFAVVGTFFWSTIVSGGVYLLK
jgi:hypothetical protein